MELQLRGRTAVLYGDFDTVGGRDAAVRRLVEAGARVEEKVTEPVDFIFCAHGERGPLPRTDAMLATPFFDEEALLGMLERAEGSGAGAAPDAAEGEGGSAFPGPADYAGLDADALRALLDGADWSAFRVARDLPPLRARLAELARDGGVTEAHRVATRRLRETGEAELRHPYGHDVEIVGHALSPDGRWLATGSWVGDDYDQGGVLQVWDVAGGRCVNTVPFIDGGVGWPDYSRTIQWSADSTRLALAHSTNMIGVWDPAGAGSNPLATVDVSNGNSRPSAYALAPDGRSVYTHCDVRLDGGLQGCLVPLDRGALFWLPGHAADDHPFIMARSLPPEMRRRFERSAAAVSVPSEYGEEIEEPVFSPDGTRLYGSNALCVDAATREVVWFADARTARLSPDGRTVAAVTRRGLSFHDAADGRIRSGPHKLGRPCALRWAAGADRLAVLTRGSDTSGPGVHVFDGEVRAGVVSIAHPGWADGGGWTGDRNAWAWAPDGQRAACLTSEDAVEVWDLADPARPWRLRTVPAEGIDAVHWGADGTLVMVGDRRVRFVRACTGDVVGDFTFLREPQGRRPVERCEAADELREQMFALDEDTWAMTLEPDVALAPPGREESLESVLTWAVGRRHAWPVHWGGLRVLPDALTAADLLDSYDGQLLRESRAELAEIAAQATRPAGPDGPAQWPPRNTAGLDALYAAAHRSVAGLDPDTWGFATGPCLRAAARLRARQGVPDAAMALAGDIPDVPARIAALSDVAACLAGAGLPTPARTAYDRAAALVAEEDGQQLAADAASSFAGACEAVGERASADGWFRRARAAIEVEPDPWRDHIAVAHSMLACGREDLVRELLADRDGHPPGSPVSGPEWLVHLVRGGHLDLADAFQRLPGWDVPSEVLKALAEAGRTDLIEDWGGGHDWYVGDLLAEARAAAAHGTVPVRPLTPTEDDVRELAKGYYGIQRTPRARRQHPTELLVRRAAQCGHFSAALDLLDRIPDTGDFNDRPAAAFGALWLALTGFDRTPW